MFRESGVVIYSCEREKGVAFLIEGINKGLGSSKALLFRLTKGEKGGRGRKQYHYRNRSGKIESSSFPSKGGRKYHPAMNTLQGGKGGTSHPFHRKKKRDLGKRERQLPPERVGRASFIFRERKGETRRCRDEEEKQGIPCLPKDLVARLAWERKRKSDRIVPFCSACSEKRETNISPSAA